MTRTFITAGDVAEILEYPTPDAFLRRRAELEELHDFPPPAPLQARPLKWRRDAVEHWAARQGYAPDDTTERTLARGLASGRVSLLSAARTP